jgi:GTPase SAR1 family protein
MTEKELPRIIEKAAREKTTTLDLSSNQLTTLPAKIGNLRNLTVLNLGGNELTMLPAEIGNLTNLTVLNLSHNRLTTLPAEIGNLTNLTVLYLSVNQLTTLPAEIGNLTNLKDLRLSSNPLESPLPEVVKQGTKAILAYLRELEKGRKRRYETKLLILGDGNEGKTCVSRALRGLPFEKQIRTEGVEVVQWKVRHPKFPDDKKKAITLNIWDFEGQEINHQSHQFFLTERSLYLLVINGRKQFKLERAEYWLDTIRARAPRSRVILVASECENTTPFWPLDKLKANYGDLLQDNNWYFIVGCETCKGIDTLSEEIKKAAAETKQMGMEWPESYQKAEDEIRRYAEREAKVSRAVLYDEIFTKSGIDKGNFESAAEQMAAMGLITHFKDSPDLRDFVVLNPQWLTKGISLVMEDEQLEKDKGEISRQRMKKIWDKGYSGLYPTLHSCMKEFELLYDMEDEAGCLVPLRFGDIKPERIPWSDIPAAKERRVEYKLNVQPPAGIMSRFIVKTHYMIVKTENMPKGVYWHNGVFLRTGEGDYTSEALCEFDRNDRILRITVKAAFPQNMIEQLHESAKAVFSFFEGLKPERSYGCMKFDQKYEQKCEGVHSELKILYGLSRGTNIDCEIGWHEVDPRMLAYGFSSFGETAFTREELRQELDDRLGWVKDLIGDVKTSLVWIDKIYNEAIKIRRRQEELSPEIAQKVELGWRNHLDMVNEMLDNRDFNSAPAVVSIAPADGSKFNPANWFNKEYIIRPYCECEEGPHPVNYALRFKKPREWWEKTAPKLAIGVKILSAGIKIACTGLPLAIGTEMFNAVEKEVEFMKELADHLELEGGAKSDISTEAGETTEELKGKTAMRDLRQFGGEDEKRITRMKLAELFSEIAPNNYKAQQWGTLRRVRIRSDNTYRWLCEKHAAEYKK